MADRWHELESSSPFREHRNLNLPSWNEFTQLLNSNSTHKPNKITKQHVKLVEFVNIAALDALCDDADDDWTKYSPWLYDVSKYTDANNPVVATRKGKCEFSITHHRQLTDATFTELLPPGIVPLGYCDIFHHIEAIKERLRVITNTFDANQQWFDHLDLSDLTAVRYSVHEGEWTLCLDMASWYSQFAYAEKVRNFMCYEHQGKMYRWVRMAMGHRPAGGIGNGALKRLMKRAEQHAHGIAFIDNAKFTGTQANVIKAGIAFLDDCAKCNATVNELVDQDISIAKWASLSLGEKTAIVTGLVKHKDTYLGLELDHVKKTSRISSKTVDKISTIWDLREHWTLHD